MLMTKGFRVAFEKDQNGIYLFWVIVWLPSLEELLHPEPSRNCQIKADMILRWVWKYSSNIGNWS